MFTVDGVAVENLPPPLSQSTNQPGMSSHTENHGSHHNQSVDHAGDQSTDDEDDRPLTVREFRSMLKDFETSLLEKLSSMPLNQSGNQYHTPHVMKSYNRPTYPVNQPLVTTPPVNRPSTYMFGQAGASIGQSLNHNIAMNQSTYTRPRTNLSQPSPPRIRTTNQTPSRSAIKVKTQPPDLPTIDSHDPMFQEGESQSQSNTVSLNHPVTTSSESTNLSSTLPTSQSSNQFSRVTEAPLGHSSPFNKFRWEGDEDWHDVPQTWQVPLSLKSTFNYWLFGDLASKIRPFSELEAGDVPVINGNSQRTAMCKYRKCLEAIVRQGASMGLVSSYDTAHEELNEVTSMQFFDQALKTLLDNVRPGKTDKPRWTEVSAASLYDWIPKENKRGGAAPGGTKRRRAEELVNLSLDHE